MSADWFGILRYFSLVSNGVLIACTLYAGLIYRGKANERYSPANHFISELGELGTSRGARVFNGGLILAELLLIPFFIGLGTALQSILGWLGAASGIASAVACGLVGCFPMNNLKPHTVVAVAFFRLGLLTMILFGVALLAQPAGVTALPRWLGVAGLLGALSYASFLLSFKPKPAKEAEPETEPPTGTDNPLDPSWQVERPRFWRLPALEWVIFAVNMVWFLLAALAG